MINPNVMQAVGEALEAHKITPHSNEQMADTVARALNVSASDATRWLEALDDGCTVAEANSRIGILIHKENEPLLSTVARLIGKALGSVASRSGSVE